MPDVTVHPHGSRWALATSDTSSPEREFETREAALLSARELAAGGNIEVLDNDPSTLTEARGATQRAAERTTDAAADELSDPEHPRIEQGGL